METNISRRSFLRGKNYTEPAEPVYIRPPGAAASRFYELCTECDACHTQCPEDIIAVDTNGRPFLDFSKGECTFCGDCIAACPTDALNRERLANWPWQAQIDTSCWSMNAITCRMCQDTCGESAIRFKLRTGGCADPVIDLSQCTGCGACASVCPANAVQFIQQPPPQPEDVA